jgi:PAS domain S-box-containing protein
MAEQVSIEVLQRSLERARKGKKRAEDLLEQKTSELYLAKQKAEESEVYIRNVLASIDDSIFITNERGIIKDVNRAAIKSLQLSKKELVGRDITTVLYLASDIQSLQEVNVSADHFKTLIKDQSSSLNERVMVGKEQCRTIVSLASSSVLDDQKNIVDIVISTRNIEKTKELIEQLKESKAHQEHLNIKLKDQLGQLVHQEKMASLGQISAGIAHEINNPIGFVLGNINVLSDYLETIQSAYKQIQEFLLSSQNLRPEDRNKPYESLQEMIKKKELDFIIEDSQALIKESCYGSLRVKDTVSNLISFVHADEAMDMKQVDLIEALESSLKIAEHQIKDHVTVIKKFGILPLLICYAGQLNQVFLSLITNAGQAIKASGDLVIETKSQNGYIIITFSDTGSGISPEHLVKLFDPFFTTKGVGKGTGLGLSISKGIIDQHHGQIYVDSTLGKGTTFTIRLPLKLPII